MFVAACVLTAMLVRIFIDQCFLLLPTRKSSGAKRFRDVQYFIDTCFTIEPDNMKTFIRYRISV